MLSKLAVKRLTKLADYMDKLPKKAHAHFDMGQWVLHNDTEEFNGEHGLKRGALVKKDHLVKCGMAACALGWAATIPEFFKAGLKTKIGPRVASRESELIAYPVYKRKDGFEAAAAFFDITEFETEELFQTWVNVKTQKEWAAHCRKFLKANVAAKP